MKKLNILQLGTMDNKGGAAKVSWNLKNELEKQGHIVSMIVGYKKSSDSSVFEIFNTPFNRFVSSIIKKNFYQRVSFHLAYLLSNDIYIPLAKRVCSMLPYKNADIIHAHNLHTNFFNLNELPNLSHQKPFVWTLHDMWAITGHNTHAFSCEHWRHGGCDCILPDSIPRHRKNNSQRLWEKKKKMYDNSRLNIVVPSQWLFDNIKKSILKNQPITLIYNGVDTNIFSPKNKTIMRKKFGLPLNKKIIIFSSKGGKKNIWKGWKYIEYILEKTKGSKDLFFLCVGSRDTNDHRANIGYIDYINNPSELSGYYSASDILLYPSIADNCPLTVLEAMACGLPVLTFNTGGIPEIVENKLHGYVAQYKNEIDLLDGFKYLTTLSLADYEQASRNCRKNILEKFNLDLMTQKYLQLYYSLLKK